MVSTFLHFSCEGSLAYFSFRLSLIFRDMDADALCELVGLALPGVIVIICQRGNVAIFCSPGRFSGVQELFSYVSSTLRLVGFGVSTFSGEFRRGDVYRLAATQAVSFSLYVFSLPDHSDFLVQGECLQQYCLLR